MSQKQRNRTDNHEHGGLIRGDHAYYASSLGTLYWWLDRIVLAGIKKPIIAEAMLINFHIGMRCDLPGTITRDNKPFSMRLSSSNLSDDTLISRVLSLATQNAEVHIAACSAAVVTEGYENATPQVKHYMRLDYNSGNLDEPVKFQTKVNGRLAQVIQRLWRKQKEPLFILRSVTDLPATCLYLRFADGVRTKGPHNHTKPVRELLAAGIYDTSHAVHVICKGKDLEIPTQILLSQTDGSQESRQMRKLVESYRCSIRRFGEKKENGTGRIFLAYYGEDKPLGKRLRDELARKRPKYEIVDGYDLARPGQKFITNFLKQAPRCDYSISIFPRTFKRGNVAFEHGYFVNRLGESRALAAGTREAMQRVLSDTNGIIHFERPAKKPPLQKEVDCIFKKVCEQIP